MKSKKQGALDIAPLFIEQDDLCSDLLTKSNLLCEHFQSVFTNEDFCTMPRLNMTSYPTMSHITIHSFCVENLFENLIPHEPSGPDAMPACLLCELSAAVAVALSFVSQMSLDTGQIPDDWRMAYVVPVCKRGYK